MPITSAQQRHLKERLQSIANSKPSRYTEVAMEEPAAVKKAQEQVSSARKVIDAFEEKKTKAKEARNEAIAKMRRDCDRSIFFGTAAEALAAIDKFEATKF
jgi:hypothetical protein